MWPKDEALAQSRVLGRGCFRALAGTLCVVGVHIGEMVEAEVHIQSGSIPDEGPIRRRRFV